MAPAGELAKMKHNFLLFLVAIPVCVYAQAPNVEKWNTVEILCGKLIRSESVPTKGSANSFTEKTKPLKNAIISLYLRTEGTACCGDTAPIVELNTSRDGHFEFKKVVAGAYWIVARVEGVDYKIAVTYKPYSKSDAKCSDVLYALKGDHLEIERLIQVD